MLRGEPLLSPYQPPLPYYPDYESILRFYREPRLHLFPIAEMVNVEELRLRLKLCKRFLSSRLIKLLIQKPEATSFKFLFSCKADSRGCCPDEAFFNDVDTFTAVYLFLLSPLPIDTKRSKQSRRQSLESLLSLQIASDKSQLRVSSCNASRNINAPMTSSLRPQRVDWTYVERNVKNCS
jgi:hypothetical protein